MSIYLVLPLHLPDLNQPPETAISPTVQKQTNKQTSPRQIPVLCYWLLGFVDMPVKIRILCDCFGLKHCFVKLHSNNDICIALAIFAELLPLFY